MPAIPYLSPLHSLVIRDTANNTAPPHGENPLQVVCAFPISGNYGTGNRVLYYVLIVLCVFARKAEWLRKACLAAALLFPAIASLHAIVLAAVHVSGAVDLDIFGAFQLCSIGILAGPVTVRLSRTYFFDPGRNIIFIWTGLVLAGLLSLVVEFYRISTTACYKDSEGKPISPDKHRFPYGEDSMCGLKCSIKDGPKSPLRGGAVNNIYVIPAPDRLAFGTATLLAAACCIPAILSLASMWNKILEINWKARFKKPEEDEDHRNNQLIEGTNGATIGTMNRVNYTIRFFLSIAEIPVYGGAVLAILIIGETNLFSSQLTYQTEPIASVGQWAPIVGSGLAALGSLYVLMVKEEAKEEAKASQHHCSCAHHHQHSHAGGPDDHPGMPASDAGSTNEVAIQGMVPDLPKVREKQDHAIETRRTESPGPITTPQRAQLPSRVNTEGPPGARGPSQSPPRGRQVRRAFTTTDLGGRRKVAETFTKIGVYLGTPGADWGNSDFKSGKALDFPEIPGEENRNEKLQEIRERYNRPSEHIPRSRTGSMNSRAPSIIDSDPARKPSLHMTRSRSNSPLPRSSTDAQTEEPNITFSEPAKGSTPSSGQVGAKPLRRATLTVPPESYGSSRNKAPGSPTSPTSPSTPIIMAPGAQSAFTVEASPEFETPRADSIPSIQIPTPP